MEQGTHYLERPFLAKQVPDSSKQPHTKPVAPPPPYRMQHQTKVPANIHRPIDSTILSLGLMLIQIITGKSSEQLHMEEGMMIDAILEKQTIASKIYSLVVQNGVIKYAGAVQCCLGNFLSVASLDNEDWAGQFDDAVISKLETDMKFLCTAASFSAGRDGRKGICHDEDTPRHDHRFGSVEFRLVHRWPRRYNRSH